MSYLWGPPLREQLRGPCAQAEMSPSPRREGEKGYFVVRDRAVPQAHTVHQNTILISERTRSPA